jgi:hypothetical protein
VVRRDKVLIVGGAGHFGNLLIEDLRRYTHREIVAPPRTVLDLHNSASIEAALRGVTIAICAAGPFQALPLTLAELCLESGIHYIDLADDRTFVMKVRSLADPNERSSAVCSGWSTVSALSGALAGIGSAGLDSIEAIYIHMAPGNRLPRAAGTIRSLLYSVGSTFSICRSGKWRSVDGWSEPRAYPFPDPVGTRSGYLVDVPDHELFPEMFDVKTVEFRAASELSALNAALSCVAWLMKKGLAQQVRGRARLFQRGAALFGSMGHDWGAVGVEVIGRIGSRNVTRRVCVLARTGGQRIAVMPASIMTSMLLAESGIHGLVSPKDWITPQSLRSECEKRGYELTVEEY